MLPREEMGSLNTEKSREGHSLTFANSCARRSDHQDNGGQLQSRCNLLAASTSCAESESKTTDLYLWEVSIVDDEAQRQTARFQVV